MVDFGGPYLCYNCRGGFVGSPYKVTELGRKFCSETCWSILTGRKSESVLDEVRSITNPLEKAMDGDVKFVESIEAARERLMAELIKTYPDEEGWRFQADLWMRIYNSKTPIWHEVTGFDIPPVGSIYMDQDGRLHTRQEGTYFPGMCPLFKRIECQHKDVYTDYETSTVHCKDCDMVRKLGDWE